MAFSFLGEGLGRRGEGRVEPVSAVIYPAGKSLDWCMEKREAIGECKDSYTAEKVLARQKRKEEARSRRRYLASKVKSSYREICENFGTCTLGSNHGRKLDIRQ